MVCVLLVVCEACGNMAFASSCALLWCHEPQELEKHTAAFVEQSKLLATWDSAVLSNRHALLDLEAELRAVHAGQEALHKQLTMIETHQGVRGQPLCVLPATEQLHVRAVVPCRAQARCMAGVHMGVYVACTLVLTAKSIVPLWFSLKSAVLCYAALCPAGGPQVPDKHRA